VSKRVVDASPIPVLEVKSGRQLTAAHIV